MKSDKNIEEFILFLKVFARINQNVSRTVKVYNRTIAKNKQSEEKPPEKK